MSDQAVSASDTNETQPIQFVGYTRPSSFPGTPEQLEALADAYAGFQWVFICNALLFCILWFVVGVLAGEVGDFDLILLIGVIIVTATTALSSIRPCLRYAKGLGRSPAAGIATAAILSLQSCICFGLFGFSSVMRQTITEIGRYGIRPRFWGINRADVAIRAAEMRANPSPPPPTVPPTMQNP